MLDSKKIEEFVESIKKGHTYKRKLEQVTTIQKYTDQNIEFVQIAFRTLLPIIDFTKNSRVDNSFLARQLGENIRRGEMNYLLKFINEKIEPTKTIQQFNFEEFNQLLDEIKFIPSHIFLPIDACFQEFHKWKNIKYLKDGLKLERGANLIDIIWSNKFFDFKNIVLLDKKSVITYLKQVKDMKLPPNVENYKNKLGDDSFLQVLVGRKGRKLDLIIRTVIAIDIVRKPNIKICELK